MADTAAPASQPKPTGIDALPFRLRALLEPKGFIKIAEFILAICMFSTTAGFSSMFSFKIDCAGTYIQWNNYTFSYPFDLSKPLKTCSEEVYLTENPAGSAKFFVAVGVLTMLYCIAALLWYVVLEVHFEKWDFIPLVDFIVTCIITLTMFIASCAWASGLGTLKYYTNYNELVKSDSLLGPHCIDEYICTLVAAANYASLGFSVTFGFLNTVVWGGNAWFTWKETPWFRARAAQDAQQADSQKESTPPV